MGFGATYHVELMGCGYQLRAAPPVHGFARCMLCMVDSKKHHTSTIPASIPAPYQHHTSTIPAPYQHHTSTIPAPYQHHTSTIPAPYQHHTSTIPASILTLLARDVDTLQNISSTLSNTISSVLTNADNLTATIKDFTLSFGNRTVRKYGDRLKSWITTFFTFAQNFIATKAANCRPVHTIYEGVVDYLCDFTVDTMNGFWLSCGWACFFFVPAIIMGTCLERFYRRMTYEEGFDTNEEGFQHSPGTELRELQYSDPQKC
ncbi:prominin-1-like [Sycon ciliatum]|uniref:prominin-1-like n=1 Tax=Sycon ciliatum TaxID=27933 RepID=UPI0031F63C9F